MVSKKLLIDLTSAQISKVCFNNMRAVINTSAPSLGEEGTKTIGDLKRQIVLIEEEEKIF